ncbi:MULTISPECIES: transcription antitermination factor NusB [unclassified Brevibacterium]|uniref:transcription antitermination factor NusB n=1 Tax=unclassified Brevibacterium TaxID=2614124 RepID=UPI001BAB20B2|nr:MULTISPECIES: transcription antitermination factor NusB [unclassified Brevibacterium]QUL80354.1 transcription antitermination factor NusB [Brevibacterium sp. SMBL_HHYL_HB1]
MASARTRARRRALELLFEAGQRRLAMDELVAMRSNDPDYPMKEYAVEIVSGITERQSEIDEIISTYAQGWTLDRMPAVDRSLLEIGTWEILFNDDVPDKVAIDEAVSLARQFSTDDSPGFISGLLSRILDVKPTLI